MLCLKGSGQVFLRGQWIDIEAGDIAYYPEGIGHAIRNNGNDRRTKDFGLVLPSPNLHFNSMKPQGTTTRVVVQ